MNSQLIPVMSKPPKSARRGKRGSGTASTRRSRVVRMPTNRLKTAGNSGKPRTANASSPVRTWLQPRSEFAAAQR